MVPFTGHLVYHLWYEWVHLAHHSKSYKPISNIGKKLRDAHMSHHFHNENYNWGITNMIGDYFFGSLKNNKSIICILNGIFINKFICFFNEHIKISRKIFFYS